MSNWLVTHTPVFQSIGGLFTAITAFITAIVAGYNLFLTTKAKRYAKESRAIAYEAKATGEANGMKLDAIHDQVNGRLSEIIAKVPEHKPIPVYVHPKDVQVKPGSEMENYLSNSPE